MAILAVGALLLSQCGDGEEATDGDQETTDTTAEVSDVPTTMAFEPPPMQATTVSGNRPSASMICERASSPMTHWKSRTISG